jgi:phospholipid/cholesterol/gamma-HCH transport system permease protein
MSTESISSAEPGENVGPGSAFLAAFGAPVVETWRTVREINDVLVLTLYYLVRGNIRWRAVLEQMYEIGNRSLVFIAFTLGFLGMILIYQAGFQAMQITGDLQLLGGLFLQLLLREFAPTITAMMIATRVGTGMAAEIGSMVVTEQVDALKMCAAQPIEYLVVPRFIASTVMMVCLVIFAVLVSYLAGAVTANTSFGLNFRTFFDLGFIGPFDIIIGFVKALAYGMAIPVIACHSGLVVFGGSEGVGRATTQAVVNASLAVVILDFLISGLGYVVLALA